MAHPHTCCSRVGPLRPFLSASPPAEHVAGSPLNPAAATTWSGILKTHLDGSLLRTLAKLLHSRLGPDYTWEDSVGSLVNVPGRGFYGLTCSPLPNLEHRRFRLSPTTLTFRIDWSLIFVYSRGSGSPASLSKLFSLVLYWFRSSRFPARPTAFRWPVFPAPATGAQKDFGSVDSQLCAAVGARFLPPTPWALLLLSGYRI